MKMLLLTAAAIVSAAPAFAQDADPAAPPPPATTSGYAGGGSSFAGPRVEFLGGWDRVGTRFREQTATGRVTGRDHANGFTGGAQVGYDLPVGERFVAGAFGSYMLSTARSCYVAGCLKSDRQIEGGARVGAKLMGDKALAYVKGAYVNGRFRDTADDVYGNRNGWRAGAGLEYALNPHLYTKVEYDYTRYDSFHFDQPTYDQSLRFDRNQVLAGFGVRF